MSKRRRVWLLSALVSLLATSCLFVLVDLSILKNRLEAVRPELLALAAVFVLLTLWTRAQRLRLLLPRRDGHHQGGLLTYQRATAWHHAAVVLLPSGLGDAVLPFVVKQMLSQSLVEATTALCVLRFQDLLVLLGLCVLAIGSLLGVGGVTLPVLVVLIGVVLGTLVILLVRIDTTLRWALSIGQQLLSQCGKKQEVPVPGVFHSLTQATRWVDDLYEKQHALTAWSIATWLSACMTVWLVFVAYAVSLSIADTFLLLTGMNIVGIFAVFSIAGFGVAEGGLIGLLMVIGLPFVEASALALAVRPTLVVLNVVVPLAIEAIALVLNLLKPKLKDETTAGQTGVSCVTGNGRFAQLPVQSSEYSSGDNGH